MKRIDYPPRYERTEPEPESFWVTLGVALLLVAGLYVIVCMAAVLATVPSSV